jgi:hypothetical protein
MRNLKESIAGTLLAAALLALPDPASAADLMRCGSRLIGTEALASEVRRVCGEPDYIDRWGSSGADLVGGPYAGVEEWYYNFGPSQLLRILHLQQGRVTDIQTDGYGFGTGGSQSCSPYDMVEGVSKYRLVANCGEPESKRAEYYLRPLGGPRDTRLRRGLTSVFVEHWLYNFGPNNLMRRVTLENGRVAEVQSEGRGHDGP